MKHMHSRILLPLFALALATPGLGFAAASNPGMLGAALAEVSEQDAKSLDLPGVYGAKVEAVAPGGPAEQAGMKSGDIIVAYNGQHIEGTRTVQRLVYESPAGRTVEIRVIREGKPRLLTPTLGTGQATAQSGTASARPPRSLGVWIEPINPAVGDYLGLDEGIGMIVREVKEGSPAANAGIQPKDVLVAIGDTPVDGAEALAEHIRTLSGYSAPITLMRGNEKQTLDVTF